jgi:TonB family protein
VEFAAEKITIQDGKVVFTVVEEMPEFPGGEKALRDFIGSTVKYPEGAKNDGIQGKVYVTFVVKSDGTVGDAKIARSAHPLLDSEAIRVINLLPTWKPGKQGGKEVNVAYTIPVQFKLDGDKNAKQALPFPAPKVGSQRPDGVYIVVEEMPEFPGGELALRDFMASTVKYPADAVKENIQGKVFVTFVVKADGTVGDAKIARGAHPLLDDEAIRVVNLLPVWKPGRQKGEAVSVSYTVPVKFALDGAKSEKKTDPSLAAGPQKGEKQVFIVVEEMPEFPGGADELRRFIARTVKYPAEAIKDKAMGKVLVSFVVSSTGKVENPKIERAVNPALDAEAIRVVNLMPEWKPGKQRGQAVSVAYTIPIDFKLQ